jgi:V/A-type H+-transporting ATPase subunit C
MIKTKKTSPLNYAFAIGKIKARERYLIRQEVFEEAIEAELGEALRLFVESGLYSDELLHIENSRQLEAILKKAMLGLKKEISELVLDKVLLGLLDLDGKKCADYILQNFQSRFLEDYLRHLLDMYNIKTFLRLYILGEPQEVLEKNILCGGFIKKEVFLNFYSQDLMAFITRLEYVHKHDQIIDYAYFLKEAIEKAQEERSFVLLEKAMNDFLIEVLKPAKQITFGPEPVLAYYFAKVNEINLVRMVILAKLNNLSKELVKERLNFVYA